MKKVLFPFHIEEGVYKEAFISAVKFARTMNAELIMLNTFEINVDNTITQEKYDKLIKNPGFVHERKKVMVKYTFTEDY